MDSCVIRRRASVPKAGSVWETRMKLDQVKGGIKVFHANHQNHEENAQIVCTSTSGIGSLVNDKEVIGTVDKVVGAKQSPVRGGRSGSAKRKTWKSDGLEGSPIQIGRQRSEVSKNLDEKLKESSDSADVSAKKSPVQTKNTRSVSVQLSVGKFDKIPVGKESRSEEELGVCEVNKKIELEIADNELEIKERTSQEAKPKKSVTQDKKLLLGNQKYLPNSPNLKNRLPPAADHAKFLQNPTKIKPIPDSDHFHGVSRTRNKLQCFADLIMWKDVAKSSFVFGIGTFAIISSSYTKDLNISFISVVSYLGLAYLVVNFLFRSLVSRGTIDKNTMEDYVIGEEEAIWVIKLVIPYLNEFLIKLRALFSGDPATTMKLAVLLFVLARCGSSITIWKMAKLGFFGVFTVPKVCSSYSVQITAYGTLWIRRFSDAWESCFRKKAVGFAINLSYVIARIWTVFMSYVAFKYYQHCLIRDECGREEGSNVVKVQRQTFDPSLLEARKPKKVC